MLQSVGLLLFTLPVAVYASITYPDIANRVAMLEFGDPANPPVYPSFLNNSFTIAYMDNIRGKAARVEDGVPTFGLWTSVLVAKLAIIAFLTGNVLPPVAPSSVDLNYVLWFGDECMDDTITRSNTNVCNAQYASTKFNSIIWGNELQNRPFPPSKAGIGSWDFPASVAQSAVLKNIPMAGWVSRGDLDKKDYPTYFRVVPRNSDMARAAGLMLRKVNSYTRIDLTFCDTPSQRSLAASYRETLMDIGILSSYEVFFPRGFYHLMPPAFMAPSFRGRPTGAKERAEKYDNIQTSLKANNAHAHMFWADGDCQPYDILHYYAYVGLIGPGHFWIGASLAMQKYLPGYLGPLQSSRNPYARFSPAMTPYAFGLPLDGLVTVEEAPGMYASAFDEWVPTLEDKKHLLFEPWILQHMPSGFLANYSTMNEWSKSWDRYSLFDAVWVYLLAAHSLTTKTGSRDFSAEELFAETQQVDFQGVSGRIRFSPSGQAYPNYVMYQWLNNVRTIPPPSCANDPNTGKFDYTLIDTNCNFPPPPQSTVVATYTDVLEITTPLVFNGGGSEPPPDENKLCTVGKKYNVQTGQCVDCEPGYFNDKPGQAQCDPCAPGSFSDTPAAGTCTSCSPGTISATPSATMCTKCSEGTFTSQPQQSVCQDCSIGRYSNVGADDCSLCVSGKYQDLKGQGGCKECHADYPGTTSKRGASSSEECFCSSGSYFRPGGFGCTTCGEGLSCPIGGQTSDIPSQQAGFYVEIVDADTRKYDVYECFQEKWCPAGALQSCDHDRAGRSCARVEGTKCPIYLPIVGLSLMCVGIYGMYRMTLNGLYGKISVVSMLVGNLGIAVGAMQAINVYSLMYTEVPVKLNWLFAIAEIFMLRWQVLWPECSIGQSFSARIFVGVFPPITIVGISIFLVCLTKLLAYTPLKKIAPPMDFDNTWNTGGTIIQILYIMQCKDAFSYFASKANPCGKQTLQDFGDIILWSDEHVAVGPVLIMCYLGLVYVVGTFALISYAVIVAPHRISERRFWHRWRFVFSRWRPECRQWGLCLLFRNMCIALVPIIVRTEDMSFRVLAFVLILIVHAICEAYYSPWLVYVHNHSEIVISGLICALGIMGMGFHEGTTEASQLAASWVMGVCFCLIWAVTIWSLFYSLAWNSNSAKKKRATQHNENTDSLLQKCAELSQRNQDEDQAAKWKKFSKSISVYDNSLVDSVLRILYAFENDDPIRRRLKSERNSTISGRNSFSLAVPENFATVEQNAGTQEKPAKAEKQSKELHDGEEGDVANEAVATV